jgi:glutamate-5-semialdehyde dehydrogenase
MVGIDSEKWIQEVTARSRRAATAIANATSEEKDRVLRNLAAMLRENAPKIEEENRKDIDAATQIGLSDALQDRLALQGKRIADLADAVEAIADLPDPVGKIESMSAQPSGIRVGKMLVPLGVVMIVYESRPNVTIDAGALCLKAGNAVLLRGGREAIHTNRLFAALLRDSLVRENLPADVICFVENPDRKLLYRLLQQVGKIDLAIPRGGKGLIDAVNEHARVPVIQHYQGICHVYVHEEAELEQALRIVVNAKVQRPGVCNAMECVVVDEKIAAQFLPEAARKLLSYGVELRACEKSLVYLPANHDRVFPAAELDYDTEFLRLACAVKIVKDYDEGVAFLRAHGSQHTESIVTQNQDVGRRFLREVDASCVMVNASTRFNDGGELGLGAELGISTTKLHAYGPMGLEELCTKKFIVLGQGETRGSPP